MQDFNLHMHTTYCDGKDTAEAMTLAAIEEGLKVAGFSGHSFTPHDQSYCMSREGTQKYIEEILRLREKYAGSIRLLLGIELDCYYDVDLSPYDYRIGSVHYLFSDEGKRKREAILARHGGGAANGASAEEVAASDDELGALVKFSDWSPVDDYAEDLCRFAFSTGADTPGIESAECENQKADHADSPLTEDSKDSSVEAPLSGSIDQVYRKNKMLEIAELYFDTVGDIIPATDCDIIGHFDLITKFSEGWGFGPSGNVISRSRCGAAEFVSDIFDTSDERYIAAWKRAIDRIFEDCAVRYKNGYRNRLEKLGVLEAGDKPVFEINTGAISKGYRTQPYPSADQIAYIKSKGGVLILSSDSHAAGTICSGFEEFAYLL